MQSQFPELTTTESILYAMCILLILNIELSKAESRLQQRGVNFPDYRITIIYDFGGCAGAAYQSFFATTTG